MTGMAPSARITIRVHPGASRPRVAAEPSGAGSSGRVLGIWVSQRAVDGQANRAALTALATAIGVRRGALRLVSGVTSRVKLVEVTDPPDDLAARIAALGG